MNSSLWSKIPPVYKQLDPILLLLIATLMTIGFVAVSSASVAFADSTYADPWFFSKRYLFHTTIAFAVGAVVLAIPTHVWQRYSGLLLLATVLILLLVLVPGIGRKINGSQRWINLGVMSVQTSEVAKFLMIIFFAGLLTRHREEIVAGWSGLIKPLMVIGLVVLLLLLEPDFGSSVVIATTLLGMLFVAGVRLFKFLVLIVAAVAALALVAVMSPYRMQRLITFLDPWADQFNTGYQLTQSLIAFGRGEWLGLGLGNSVQKLFFLPEAHTDFISAIIAEEVGFLGLLLVVIVFSVLIFRVFSISKRAFLTGRLFAGYCALGVTLLLSIQGFINLGVASGLLPTKGLTLPFVSYGGSSLLSSVALMALVLRLDWEHRTAIVSRRTRRKRNSSTQHQRELLHAH